MSEKTIHEIKEEFSSAASGVLNSYYQDFDEVVAQRAPEAGGYLAQLTDQQRMNVLREQKMERARELTHQVREDYTSELERYHENLSRRADYLKARLFKVEDAGALSRAALASDTELGTLLEIATQAGNAELGRAVFVAAEQRGLGNLMVSYFERMGQEARQLYQEWTQVPAQELLDRQVESVETVLPEPDPDRLMPPTRAAS